MSNLRIRQIQPFIGAEIEGVDLRDSMDASMVQSLRDAWLKYKVLIFRNQSITRQQHLAFGSLFGTPECHPAFGESDQPEIIAIREKPGKQIGEWHTDVTYKLMPPSAAILRSHALPSIGGDTIFTNTAIAYERLDASIKRQIANLQAEHAPGFERLFSDAGRLRELNTANPPSTHPVVTVHPDTGECALFVNEYFTTRLIDLLPEVSEQLLAVLYEQIKRPEYQMRINWQPNTVVIWDERVTQHYAVADYSEPRHLDRVTLSGERPIGLMAA